MLRATAVLTGLLLPCSLLAHPGLIEINQSVVDAAGGFPYTISAPGSYVLTGPLVVPADTDGIVLATNEVTLDLNGFSVKGPAVCNPTTCPLGTGSGIRPEGPFGGANHTRVHNGIVGGFGSDCVRVLGAAQVENLTVSECGGSGIVANVESIVARNRVRLTGRSGITMSSSVLYSHNAVAFAGLGGGGHRAVSGGRVAGANSCDDGSCRGFDTRRRYYLTHASFDGASAADPGNCAEGFHFASLYELSDPGSLSYDQSLGWLPSDGGGGPAGFPGWIRTGGVSSDIRPGRASCSGWTSADFAQRGSLLAPNTGDSDWSAPAIVVSPWFTEVAPCSAPQQLWCVED